MKKIGDVTNTADKSGEFTNGNVAVGTPPTTLEADWFNSLQREMLNILSSAGIEQSAEQEDQLAVAIHAIIKEKTPELVQETGDKIDVSMSQKAVTDAISDSQVNVPDATTEVKGKVKLSNDVSDNKESAATPFALNKLNGNIDGKIEKNEVYLYKNAAIVNNQLTDENSAIFACFGDSTMWGSTANDSLVKNPINPSDVLQQTFNLIFGSGKTVVKNEARPGTSLFSLLRGADGGAGTYEDRLLKTNASVVYCNHCQNDCNSFNRTTEEYKEDLITFIKITRKHNKIPVLVTPNISAVFAGVTEKMTRRLPAFIDAMQKVAHGMGVDLVDNYYYTLKCSRVMSIRDIVPDGVHPSSDIYAVIGRNLAIPFVAAHTLKIHGDIASLSNASYRDTITGTRNLRNANSLFSRQLSWDAQAAPQTVFYPVILDNPTDDTLLAFGGFQWSGGGKSRCNYSGNLSDPRFSGEIDQYRGGAGVDENAFYFPEVCNLLPGFHVVGLTNNTQIEGKSTSFAGVILLDRNNTTAGKYPYKKGFQLNRVISAGDEISFSCFVSSVSGVNQTFFTLTEVLDGTTTWLTIKRSGNSNVVSIEPHGGVSKDIVTGVTGGEYHVRFKINRDRTITVTFGNATVTTDAANFPLPTCFVSSRGFYYVTNE